jgi:polygalacturonase
MLRRPLFTLLTLAFVFIATAHAALTQPVVPIAPAAPKIPSARVSLADFGGNPDGITLNTDAFTRAIAALSAKGGGTLIVPPGIWHTGPIALKSRINLHLEAGSLIQFSRDTTLYPLRHFKARSETFVDSTSPLSGDNLEDIAITGSGVIDGGGDAWRLVKKSKMTEGAWKALVESGGVLNDKKNEWWPSKAALEGGAAIAALEKKGSTDISEHAPWQIFLRPRLVRLLDCKRVLIEGVTVRNAPNWTLHPWLCEDLTLRDVKIFNNRWAQNSDAMDIDSCRRVHIKGCIIDTGDDGICIKSGINESGRRIGVPTEDVLVEDCVVYEGHGGFTIGSEMSGGVRNILVQNCTFIGTALGLRFKTSRGRGGLVENIHMRGIRMSHIEGNAIDFNFFYWVKGHPEPTAPAVDEGTPQFRNMLFEDITARDGTGTLVLRGLPEMPINNLTFRNVTLAGEKGADIANSDAIVFENVRIENKTGDALTTTAVTNSKLDIVR